MSPSEDLTAHAMANQMPGNKLDLFGAVVKSLSGVSRDTRRIVVAAFCINLFAYGFLFANLTLNHDGFGFITLDASWTRGTGRWLTDVLYAVLFRNFELIWLNGLLAMCFFIATALSISRVLRLAGLSERLVVALLYTLFPYMCSYYGYAFHVPIYALSSLLAVSAVEVTERGGLGKCLLGALLLAASLACYQAFVASALTLVMLGAAAALARAESRESLTAIAWRVGRQMFALGLGCALYWLSIKVSVAVFNVQLVAYQGAASMGASDFAAVTRGLRVVLIETARFLGGRFQSIYPESSYFTWKDKALCAVVYLGAIAGIAAMARRMRGRSGAAVLMFLMALFAPRVLQVAHPDGNYHELTLTGYGVYLAGAAAFAMEMKNRIARSAVQLVLVVLICSFIHSNNVGAAALAFDYQAIMHWGNRVLAMIEADPRCAVQMGSWAPKRIMFVGDAYRVSDWFYRGRPFVTAVGIADGIPNIVFDSIFRLLRVNATSVGIPPQTHSEGLAYAARHEAWPHPESVTVLRDGTIVVVLSKPADGSAGVGR